MDKLKEGQTYKLGDYKVLFRGYCREESGARMVAYGIGLGAWPKFGEEHKVDNLNKATKNFVNFLGDALDSELMLLDMLDMLVTKDTENIHKLINEAIDRFSFDNSNNFVWLDGLSRFKYPPVALKDGEVKDAVTANVSGVIVPEFILKADKIIVKGDTIELKTEGKLSKAELEAWYKTLTPQQKAFAYNNAIK